MNKVSVGDPTLIRDIGDRFTIYKWM